MSGARNASDRVIRIERSAWPSRKASDSSLKWIGQKFVEPAMVWIVGQMSAFVICNGSFDGSRCRFHPRPRTAALGLRVHPRLRGLKTLSLRPWHGPSIYRSIIEAHGGRLWMSPRAPRRQRPLRRSGMGGAVGPEKIRKRPYSLSKGSGHIYSGLEYPFWVCAYPAFLRYSAHSAGGYWVRISPQAPEIAS
jgi:hypothetical protein